MVLLALAMWVAQYELRPPAANFHIFSIHVGSDPKMPNRLFLNIYIQNDSGDAEITHYGATFLVTDTPVTLPTFDKIIADVRKGVDKLKSEGHSQKVKFPTKEIRWFANISPPFSDEQLRLYAEGKGKFYFLVMWWPKREQQQKL
jgi:hypothetical protein